MRKNRELGLKSLRERRTEYDLVQTYKMINKVDRVDPSTWFNMVGQVGHIQTRNTAYEMCLPDQERRLEETFSPIEWYQYGMVYPSKSRNQDP